MQSRFALPVVFISVVTAIALGLQLFRENYRTYRLVLASASASGEYYAFSQAFSKVITRYHPRIQIEVIPTEGSQQNMMYLRDGAADLALVQSDTPVESPVRAVAMLFPELFHLIVRRDAEISTVADLAGKAIAPMPKGSGSYALFGPLSSHYGLEGERLRVVPLGPEAAHQALLQGKIDAVFRVITLGNPSIRALLQSGQVELLAIDQVDALQLALPYLSPQTIPKGAYDGGVPIPARDLDVVAVNAMLVARESVPQEVVKILTQSLYERRNELVTLYPRAAMIRLPESAEDLGLPLHPGARAFYNRDQPEFIVQYAEPLGLLFSVGVLGLSSLWQLRLWLVGRQKNRADSYNLEILDLIDRIDAAENLVELTELRHQLFSILRQVVIDLDVDRISAESFESFTFPWEMAISMIRHREWLLRSRLQSQIFPSDVP